MKRDDKGRFTKSAKWITKICKYCDSEFDIRKSQLKYGRGKYCSRKCSDLHKKETYIGENNPMYGNELSERRKKQNSKIMKELWASGSHYEKYKKGIDEFVKENGYFPGTDKESVEKRKQTMLKRYGVEHNWSGEYGRRNCDKTVMKKYGKASHLLAKESQEKFNKKTKIEIVVESILEDENIEYKYNYCVCKKQHDCRYYDFYLPKYNTLIECDGVYWHGKNLDDSELNETQIKNKNNDKYKNKLADNLGYRLIRFWGDEIKENNFDKKLLNILYNE